MTKHLLALLYVSHDDMIEAYQKLREKTGDSKYCICEDDLVSYLLSSNIEGESQVANLLRARIDSFHLGMYEDDFFFFATTPTLLLKLYDKIPIVLVKDHKKFLPSIYRKVPHICVSSSLTDIFDIIQNVLRKQ